VSAGHRGSALAPFRVRSFRFQWPADLLTSWAFEMETLILGWYVLVETGSVLMLSVFGALQYLGTLIAPMVGVLGDRIGQRNVLCGMRTIYAVLAALLCALALTGVLTSLMVFVIATLTGLVRPSDQGMRGALVAETMPADQLVSAMAISRTTSDSARIAGALAGAGLFAALGIGAAYVAVSGFYLLGALFTLGVARTPPARPSEEGLAADALCSSPWRDLRAGIAYVWNTPHLLAAMWMACLVNFCAFSLLNGMLPYVAKAVYGSDQTGLGYLVAGSAFGALLGSIGVSVASRRVHPGRLMIVFAAVWYLMVLMFAQTQSIVGGFIWLFLAGIGQSLTMVPLTVILLRTSSAHFRGRVMGVRMLAIYSLPFGLLAAGALIERIGFGATATAYAVFGFLSTLLIAARWRADLWDLRAPANAR
jgi:Na+/melibiose symporter-like transporter